jgi:hypothetical protein
MPVVDREVRANFVIPVNSKASHGPRSSSADQPTSISGQGIAVIQLVSERVSVACFLHLCAEKNSGLSITYVGGDTSRMVAVSTTIGHRC